MPSSTLFEWVLIASNAACLVQLREYALGAGKKKVLPGIVSRRALVFEDFSKVLPHHVAAAWPLVIEQLGKVAAYNAIKHGEHCIDIPDGLRKYTRAEKWHRARRLNGEYRSEETGLPHYAHELWCCFAVQEVIARATGEGPWVYKQLLTAVEAYEKELRNDK